jgi:hypothetical protein
VIDTTNLDSRYPTNVVRAKDLLGMRMPIWYDALQAEVCASAQGNTWAPVGTAAEPSASPARHRRPGSAGH